MSRRGRPPHPDILTPREWEVLSLLREGLSDDAIAERLGVSVHGAKYHVREILSKLGVSSRQEAAAWQPEERARAARWLALPLAARIGSALVIVAAVAGLGLLAWGVLRTDGDAESRSQLPELPEPSATPTFTRDQMLVLASLAVPDDTRAISLAWTTLGDAMEASAMEGLEIAGADMASPVWLVRADAVYDPCQVHECGPPPLPDQPSRTSTVGCHALFLIFPDPEYYYSGLTEDPVDGNCPAITEVTRELSILLASKTVVGSFGSDTGAPIPTAERMTFAEALQAIEERAGPVAESTGVPPDNSVWLVTISGQFVGSDAQYRRGGPAPLPTCGDRFVIVDATSGEVIVSRQSSADACP